MGRSLADLMPERPNASGKQIIATYPYLDEGCSLLYEVVRYAPKDFRQRIPDGKGGYVWKLNGVRRVPYHLPRLIDAVKAGRPVYVCEGEKDVEAVERAGGVATCNPGGAGKWRPEYAAFVRGAVVRVWADRDDPGRAHAKQVVSSLVGVARSVCVVEAAVGKDAADHLATGRTLQEAVPVEVKTAPEPSVQERFDGLVLTGPQFAARTPEHIDFIAAPYIAAAHLHEIVGKLKHGKTRFYGDLTYAVLNGVEFLGQPTHRTAVMFLMEDSDGTMRLNLERAGILRHPDLHLISVSWLFRSGLTWPDVCRCVGDYMLRHNIGLLFADTFLRWAGLTEGQENDSGACAQALAPLDAVRLETGAAVVVIHHEGKKNGGDTSDAGRGSSAIGSMMDSILVLRRVSGQGPKSARRRKLEYIGRLDAPANVVIELDRLTGHHKLIGDALTSETDQARQFLLDALPEHETRAVTEKWLCEKSGIDSSTIYRALQALIKDGLSPGGRVPERLAAGPSAIGCPVISGSSTNHEQVGEQIAPARRQRSAALYRLHNASRSPLR